METKNISKEKIIMYVWLASLIIIMITGLVFFLQRPSAKIVGANKEMLFMAERIRGYYGNRPDYRGLNTAEVINNKLHVSKNEGNRLLNGLEKEIVIGGDADGNQVMPGMRSFIIGYKGLNKKECVDLVSIRWREKDKLGLISLSVQNGDEIKEFSWGDKGLPLSRSRAKQYCGDNSGLFWTFE